MEPTPLQLETKIQSLDSNPVFLGFENWDVSFYCFETVVLSQTVTLNQNSALEIEYFGILCVVMAACNNDIAKITVVQ